MKKEKGQSLVELAISFVVLMFLLVGIVEFGIMLFQLVQLRDAAQEGAVFGSACNCDMAEIEDRIRASSTSPIDLADPAVTIEARVAGPDGLPKDVTLACEGDSLTIKVTYIHHIFMPFLPDLIGRSDVPLNAVVVNTVLSPVCP